MNKANQVEAPYAITCNGEKVIGGGFKYDDMWFVMSRDSDGNDFTNGWCVLGCGVTPEEMVASVADTLATGESIPEASLLEFWSAFKAWLGGGRMAAPMFSSSAYQFKHYLWHEAPNEEKVPMLELVVQMMPNYGT